MVTPSPVYSQEFDVTYPLVVDEDQSLYEQIAARIRGIFARFK